MNRINPIRGLIVATVLVCSLAACAPQAALTSIATPPQMPSASAPSPLPTATATFAPTALATQTATTPPTLIIVTVSQTAASGVPTAASAPSSIEGKFDVGGLKLYMHCEGAGSPTIIYLHGWMEVEDKSTSGAFNAYQIQQLVSKQHRMCAYDRRNVGRSDEVEGYWTGETAVQDLHALLAATGVKPPYVLLGASLGGLIAHIYAATYSDEVVGMVLLDSPPPAEIDLDSLLPVALRFSHDMDKGTNENLDRFDVFQRAHDLPAPKIPVTYLLAKPLTETMGVPEWDAAIPGEIEKYVNSFSPGKLIQVESPHFMETAIPNIIAQELEKLIKQLAQ